MTTNQNDYLPDELLQTKLIRNGFWMYFFSFLVAPTGYLIKIMIAWSISVEDIGIFYSILGLITILSAYNDLWLTEALQYYLPHYLIDKEYDHAKSITIYTLILQLISGVIIGWLLYFWADRLALHYFKYESATQILQYFSIYFLLLNILQSMSSFFIATQQVKRSQGIEAIRMWTVLIGTGLLLWWQSLTINHFTLIRLSWVLMACIIWYIGIHKIFWNIIYKAQLVRDKSLFQKQRKYGIWVMIGAGTGTLFWQINQQFALYYLWADAAGYWAYYLSFYTIIGIITTPLINYLFPLLNELYKKNHYDKIQYLFKLLFGGIIVFGIVWWIIWYFLAEPLSVLLFGEQFRQSGILFQHYAPFMFTIPLFGVLFQDIASRGLVKQRVGVLVLWLIANTIASFILGHQYGLTWLVYAQLIGNVVLILGWWYYFKKERKILPSH